MEEWQELPEPLLVEIPRVFFNEDTRQPFTHCMVCEQRLKEMDETYVIEKAVRYYPDLDLREVVFEYAMCTSCHGTIMSFISEASQAHLINYFFSQGIDLAERARRLQGVEAWDESLWLGHCLIKGTPVREMREYQLFAQCIGDQLLLSFTPFAIGGEALGEMASGLSQETLGGLDDLMDTYFGIPPELKRILTPF